MDDDVQRVALRARLAGLGELPERRATFELAAADAGEQRRAPADTNARGAIDASRTAVLASGLMVHWLDDAMPLQSGDDECAVIMRRNDVGQSGGRCQLPPVVEARWRFEEGVNVLRWCADHADVLLRRDRCLAARPLQPAGRRYDAAAEDVSPPNLLLK